MAQKIVLFNGPEFGDLWQTDGTVSGTFDITGSSGIFSGVLNPKFITAFDGEALFEGTDTSDAFGLWVTDGTAAGTQELTGIVGANPSGLDPQYMQVYNGMVLFQGEAGVAGDDVPGLWVTNGTAAGTFEIGGVANAGISGISPGGLLPGDPDFTVFNGKVLFSGRDAANNQGLWVTDGTAAGTFELAPISGAFAVGSPGSDVLGSGRNMTVLGNKVLFRGTDLQDTPGSLWVTDGTAAGTVEVGGQGNAAIVGSPNGFTGTFTSELPLGIQPQDLTTFNNVVLFAGFDNTLKPNGFYADTDGLWVSDGTAGGTFELGGIGNAGIVGAAPALSGGIFWFGFIEFPDFTVYNGKVLFVGYDASGHVGLWETNGTAGGTVEIGGQGNAGISGGLSLNDSQSPDFTVYNGKVLFNAIGGLWVTDGTAAGTHELESLGGLFPTDLTAVTIGPIASIAPQTIQNDYLGITRTALSLNQATTEANQIDTGGTTEAQYVESLLSQVADTTIPVVAVEASMYGAVGSSAVITNLVNNFLPGQLAYAHQAGLDPGVFACLETALVFAFANEAGNAGFANNYGPSNAAMPATGAGDAAFAAAATNAIFGSAQTANTANALLGYVHFLEGFFTANGIVGVQNPTADQIVIAARAGAWGEGVAIALENNLGSLPGQTTNFLEDAAQGTAVYSAPFSSQPIAAPFQGSASGSGGITGSTVQVTGVAAHVDHILM
jgi:ELWxxDGT repeat protein